MVSRLFPNDIVERADEFKGGKLPHKLFNSKLTTIDVQTIEASAVEPIKNDKRLLVADDNRPQLLVVDPENGEVTDILEINGVGNIPDWEGMAQDRCGNYYLTGSRGPLIKFSLNNGVINKESVVKFNIWNDLEIKREPDSHKSKVWRSFLQTTLPGTLHCRGFTQGGWGG